MHPTDVWSVLRCSSRQTCNSTVHYWYNLYRLLLVNRLTEHLAARQDLEGANYQMELVDRHYCMYGLMVSSMIHSYLYWRARKFI